MKIEKTVKTVSEARKIMEAMWTLGATVQVFVIGTWTDGEDLLFGPAEVSITRDSVIFEEERIKSSVVPDDPKAAILVEGTL
jgi:hypothetical protein